MNLEAVNTYEGHTSKQFTVKNIRDFSWTFWDCRNVFPGPSWSPPTSEYKDKQRVTHCTCRAYFNTQSVSWVI